MATDIRNANMSRRPRKLGTDEDIELRRARGELSCAECKRLKLKCDKVRPISPHEHRMEYALTALSIL